MKLNTPTKSDDRPNEILGSKTSRICVVKSRRFPSDLNSVLDGGTINAVKIAQYLSERGHAVEVFVRQEAGEDVESNIGNVLIHRIPFERSNSKNPFIRDHREARSFGINLVNDPRFTTAKFDAMHVHHWTSTWFFAEMSWTDCPIIYTPHLLTNAKAKVLGMDVPAAVANTEKLALERCHRLICVSDAERAEVHDILGSSEKCICIPNGIDDQYFTVPHASRQSKLRILTVGRICQQKGLDIAIEAVRLVRQCTSLDVSLRIVGGSYGESDYECALERASQSAEVQGAVAFLGPIPQHHLPTEFESADLYIQPSRYESQGIAILEAMAAGRPVIATDLPAVRESIVDGVSGLLCRINDPRSLATGILQLAFDQGMAERVAVAARRSASKFSWNALLLRTEEALLARP